ncbi:MAG TPA: IPT/TIG domain-containing protein, partial [Capsulimonadaceae bacterium]|nr:IPT/TIG domain-containing protein [Capsulimonadaceae bacterium]
SYRHGVFRYLDSPFGDSDAEAINDNGDIVGGMQNQQGDTDAALWKDGIAIDLGSLPNSYRNNSDALGINNQDFIVGYSTTGQTFTSPGHQHAFLYTPFGGMVDLMQGSQADGQAVAINGSGEIIGTEEDFSNPFGLGMFTIKNGVFHLIGWLTKSAQSEAHGINSTGAVVGYYTDDTTNSSEAFLYKAGHATAIGDLGTGSSIANQINSTGQIVGRYGNGVFLYTGGQMYDLASLTDSTGAGFLLQFGNAINNNGQVATMATDPDGNWHGTLLTPNNTAGSPTITGLSPASAQALTKITKLTVTGAGFTKYSTIDWGDQPLATHYVSTTTLTAMVPAAINGTVTTNTYPGAANIVVVNPAGASVPFAETITEPTPVLTSITPLSAGKGAPDTTITAYGTGFAGGAVVSWGGTPLATTFVSPDQLTAVIPASMLTKVHSAPVVVTNPSGAATASKSFAVQATGISISLGTQSRAASGDLLLPVTFTNNGPIPAPALMVANAKLSVPNIFSEPTTNPLPISLGTLGVGQSTTVNLDFTSAFPEGMTLTLTVNGTYTKGTFANSLAFVLAE